MKNLQNLFPVKGEKKEDMLSLLALLVFISMLVFNGTFFRVRPEEDIPTLDWLILARLIACALGFFIGLVLILKKHARLGFGSIVLTVFLAATGISAINSPYPTIVIGYVILLVGGGVLTLGLVFNAPDVKSLERIERVWFFTVIVCVIKDVITSLVLPQPEVGGEVFRLGMGISHANHISLLAGLVFWLSFRQTRANIIIWIVRIVMLCFIIGTVSRIGILVFTSAGFTYLFFRAGDYFKRLIFIFTSLSVIIFLLLAFSIQKRLGDPLVDYLRRGQTHREVVTFTGRTWVWKQAMYQFQEEPLTGHGYGITRFTLKPIIWDYQPPHCHNEIVEALFCTGLLGTIPLLLILLYSMKWFTSFSRLQRVFSSDIALHAACAVVMLLISMVFEARITARLLPFQPLFFYYLIILDREKNFAIMKRKDAL